MVYRMPPALVLPDEEDAETGGYDPPPPEGAIPQPEAAVVMPTTQAQSASLRERLSALEARVREQGSVTPNLALGAAPVAQVSIGGSVNVTIPLSRTMRDDTYSVQIAHSAVVSLANVTFSNVTKTTTTVTVRVTSVGVALAAGTLIVAAY